MFRLGRMNFGFSHKTPELIVTSQWQNDLSPSVKYLIYRVVLTVYFNFVLVLSLVTAGQCGQLSSYWIYLTNWNVILNAFTSILGVVLVALYYTKKITFDENHREMPMSFKVYWLFSTLSTVVCVSLSCVYWPLIYNGRDKGINDALTHAGNAIVLFVDTFITAHPPRYGHFVYPLSFGITYSYIFSVPYTILGGTDRDGNNFIYSVLDWTKKPLDALTFSILTIVFLTFVSFVMSFMGTCRLFVHKRIQSRKGIEKNSSENAPRESHGNV